MSHATLPARRTSSLSAADVTVLRGMLEQQREFRGEQLRQLRRPDARSPLSSTDPEILHRLSEGAQAALRDAHAALWRMGQGRYGLCTACGEPVEVQRLEILPQTDLCLPCRQAAAQT